MGFLKKLFKKQPKPKETGAKVVSQLESNPVPREVLKKETIPKGSTDLDKLTNKQKYLHNKLHDKDYYGSEKSKEDFKELNKEKNNYLKNNPKDFVSRAANDCGYLLEVVDRLKPEEKDILELYGKGLYYEHDLNECGKAIEIYKEVDRLNIIVMKDEIAELVKYNGEKDYLYSAKAKSRIRICNNKIQRSKIKELEAEAKELETNNPTEAIKKYNELNKINPGLKKYDKRIYKMMEFEAKN